MPTHHYHANRLAKVLTDHIDKRANGNIERQVRQSEFGTIKRVTSTGFQIDPELYGIILDENDVELQEGYTPHVGDSVILIPVQSGEWAGIPGFRNTSQKSAQGTATIASGHTSVVVSHGLPDAPALKQLSVTPTNNMGAAAKFWVESPDDDSFTIHVNADPGADATFAWQVI